LHNAVERACGVTVDQQTGSEKMFFLLLVLLRSICHRVSHQADKFDLLAITSPTFRPPIQVGYLRAMFLTTYDMQLTINKKQ